MSYDKKKVEELTDEEKIERALRKQRKLGNMEMVRRLEDAKILLQQRNAKKIALESVEEDGKRLPTGTLWATESEYRLGRNFRKTNGLRLVRSAPRIIMPPSSGGEPSSSSGEINGDKDNIEIKRGRFVVATQPYKRGDILFKEIALEVTISPDKMSSICNYCWSQLTHSSNYTNNNATTNNNTTTNNIQGTTTNNTANNSTTANNNTSTNTTNNTLQQMYNDTEGDDVNNTEDIKDLNELWKWNFGSIPGIDIYCNSLNNSNSRNVNTNPNSVKNNNNRNEKICELLYCPSVDIDKKENSILKRFGTLPIKGLKPCVKCRKAYYCSKKCHVSDFHEKLLANLPTSNNTVMNTTSSGKEAVTNSSSIVTSSNATFGDIIGETEILGEMMKKMMGNLNHNSHNTNLNKDLIPLEFHKDDDDNYDTWTNDLGLIPLEFHKDECQLFQRKLFELLGEHATAYAEAIGIPPHQRGDGISISTIGNTTSNGHTNNTNNNGNTTSSKLLLGYYQDYVAEADYLLRDAIMVYRLLKNLDAHVNVGGTNTEYEEHDGNNKKDDSNTSKKDIKKDDIFEDTTVFQHIENKNFRGNNDQNNGQGGGIISSMENSIENSMDNNGGIISSTSKDVSSTSKDVENCNNKNSYPIIIPSVFDFLDLHKSQIWSSAWKNKSMERKKRRRAGDDTTITTSNNNMNNVTSINNINNTASNNNVENNLEKNFLILEELRDKRMFAIMESLESFFIENKMKILRSRAEAAGKDQDEYAIKEKVKRDLKMLAVGGLSIFSRFMNNNFSIVDETFGNIIGTGIFPHMAMLNHSCCPNIVLKYEFLCGINNTTLFQEITNNTNNTSGDNNNNNSYNNSNNINSIPFQKKRVMVSAIAIRDIVPMEEICHSYVDIGLPIEERRIQLKNRYHFDCTCALCQIQLGQKSPKNKKSSKDNSNMLFGDCMLFGPNLFLKMKADTTVSKRYRSAEALTMASEKISTMDLCPILYKEALPIVNQINGSDGEPLSVLDILSTESSLVQFLPSKLAVSLLYDELHKLPEGTTIAKYLEGYTMCQSGIEDICKNGEFMLTICDSDLLEFYDLFPKTEHALFSFKKLPAELLQIAAEYRVKADLLAKRQKANNMTTGTSGDVVQKQLLEALHSEFDQALSRNFLESFQVLTEEIVDVNGKALDPIIASTNPLSAMRHLTLRHEIFRHSGLQQYISEELEVATDTLYSGPNSLLLQMSVEELCVFGMAKFVRNQCLKIAESYCSYLIEQYRVLYPRFHPISGMQQLCLGDIKLQSTAKCIKNLERTCLKFNLPGPMNRDAEFERIWGKQTMESLFGGEDHFIEQEDSISFPFTTFKKPDNKPLDNNRKLDNNLLDHIEIAADKVLSLVYETVQLLESAMEKIKYHSTREFKSGLQVKINYVNDLRRDLIESKIERAVLFGKLEGLEDDGKLNITEESIDAWIQKRD